MADFLSGYAAAFDLPEWLDARVIALRHAGGELEAPIRDEVPRVGQVVVVTGPFPVP